MAEKLPIIIRPCFEMDLQFVQLIYSHHVMTGAGTFETVPPDLKDMTARWSAIAAKQWPFLVACAEGDPSRVLGYAYAAQFRDREGYRHTFEDSVYVAPNAIGKGVGGALLGALLGQLDLLRVREVVAMIGDNRNDASIGVHARCGFAHVGTLSEVGFKFGRWLDVVMMQRTMKAGQDDGIKNQ